MKKTNPFESKATLVGRREILEEFENAFSVALYNETSIIALFGPKGIGKSFLLRKIEEIAEKKRFLTISLGLQKKDDAVEKTVHAFENKVKHKLNTIVKTTFEIREEKSFYQRIEESYRKIRKKINGVIFFIEKLEKIERYKELNEFLKKIKTSKKPFVIVLSSLYKPKINADKYIEVKQFSKEDTANYIEETLKDQKIKIGEEFIRKVFEDSEGNPFIVKTICSLIYEKIQEKEKTITQGYYLSNFPEIVSLLSKELFDELYSKLSDKEKILLSAMEKQIMNTKEISEKTGIPLNTVTTLLLRMEKKGSVVKVKRGLYKILSNLYAESIQS